MESNVIFVMFVTAFFTDAFFLISFFKTYFNCLIVHCLEKYLKLFWKMCKKQVNVLTMGLSAVLCIVNPG